MDRNTVQVKFTTEQLDELRRRYRLFNCSNDQVLQTVVDQMGVNPSFHTKNLPSNRTVE